MKTKPLTAAQIDTLAQRQRQEGGRQSGAILGRRDRRGARRPQATIPAAAA